MNETNRKTKIVRSYNKIWGISRVLYHIAEIELPMPITMNAILYYFTTCTVMFVIGGMLPGIWRYGVIPILLAWVFDQKLLDGKGPLQYFRSIITHYFIVIVKGSNVSRYRYYKREKPVLKTIISYRTHKALI